MLVEADSNYICKVIIILVLNFSFLKTFWFTFAEFLIFSILDSTPVLITNLKPLIWAVRPQ